MFRMEWPGHIVVQENKILVKNRKHTHNIYSGGGI